MFASTALQVLIAIAIFAAGAGSGWTVKDWKDGAEIARLESDNSTLKTANVNCATDIDGVKSAVGVITQGVEEREKAASAAMRDVETLAANHKAVVAAIRAKHPEYWVMERQSGGTSGIEAVQDQAGAHRR